VVCVIFDVDEIFSKIFITNEGVRRFLTTDTKIHEEEVEKRYISPYYTFFLNRARSRLQHHTHKENGSNAAKNDERIQRYVRV